MKWLKGPESNLKVLSYNVYTLPIGVIHNCIAWSQNGYVYLLLYNYVNNQR